MVTLRLHIAAALTLVLVGVRDASGQTAGFTPGSREIYASDFSKIAIGQFPDEFRLLRGKAQVVDKDGAHMLRAAEPMEFVVNLKENLPEAFTIEFDVIPKSCCAPEDIAFEGTPSMSRSPTSSHVSFNSTTLIVVGGGDYFQIPTPSEIAETMPNAMTHFNVSIDASGMKLYANDKLLTSLAGRKFAHGRVLRVSLGGQDDNLNAVYLGRLRIGAGGTPPTIAGNTGPTPNVSNSSTSSSSSSGSVTTTTSIQAGQPQPGLQVTVTMGSAGPVVSWTPVPDATGYAVSRYKLDDPTCCSNATGRGISVTSPWQDKPLPVSGTYDYVVTASTPVATNNPSGLIRGETQFVYTAPTNAVLASPTMTTATGMVTGTTSGSTTTGTTTTTPTGAAPSSGPRTVTTMTTAGGSTSSGSTSGSTSSGSTSGPGGVPPGCTSTATSPNTMTSPSSTSGSSCSGVYRVTLTGFRVSQATGEPTNAPDGRYDEAYASAAVILYDRTTSTVRSRADVKTREYGDIANGTIYGNRIKAGTATPQGGIWSGNGTEQVPGEFDPSGATIPAPTSDQFPLNVWQGTLNAGVEALLVVPVVWDRDIDFSPYSIWKQSWASAPLVSLFSSQPVLDEMADTRLTSVISSAVVGTPFILAIPDAQAHIKDRPIGVTTVPANLPPVSIVYRDRHVMVTQEKLSALAPGAFTTLAIPLAEPMVLGASGAIYTLYLRVDRIQ